MSIAGYSGGRSAWTDWPGRSAANHTVIPLHATDGLVETPAFQLSGLESGLPVHCDQLFPRLNTSALCNRTLQSRPTRTSLGVTDSYRLCLCNEVHLHCITGYICDLSRIAGIWQECYRLGTRFTQPYLKFPKNRPNRVCRNFRFFKGGLDEKDHRSLHRSHTGPVFGRGTSRL